MGTSVSIAYVWAIIISVCILLLAAVVAFMIPNKPRSKDISQRRTWYWILFVVCIALAFGINMVIANGITIPSKHSAYVTASAIATGVAAVIYIVVGLCLSKGMKRTKLGSWF
ncbi:MAG: hypothetical protein K2G67_05185 [Muribaculaceae bacterium]|nr:hypothetical protein [Muribaculaceae bacterium]